MSNFARQIVSQTPQDLYPTFEVDDDDVSEVSPPEEAILVVPEAGEVLYDPDSLPKFIGWPTVTIGEPRVKVEGGKALPPSLPHSTVQPTITFEQAYQQVGWQYNAGRDINNINNINNINIINVQSRGELADELTKMQREVREGAQYRVISPEVAAHLQEQLGKINKQLRSDEPQGAAILEELRATRAYLQAESDKLAQQIPQKRNDNGFFRLLVVSVATLGAIAFDLGLTAAIVTGLFGLATHKS